VGVGGGGGGVRGVGGSLGGVVVVDHPKSKKKPKISF